MDGYMEDNGFGGDYDPDRAAEWDRKAAEMGDPVGKFNYGLDFARTWRIRDEVSKGLDRSSRRGWFGNSKTFARRQL